MTKYEWTIIQTLIKVILRILQFSAKNIIISEEDKILLTDAMTRREEK